MITPEHWAKAISYQDYRGMIDTLLAEGKTSGKEQSEQLTDYTRMNVRRMIRWEKTATLSPELLAILPTLPAQKWLVLTEGWCGDAAQNLPVLAKIAEASPQIELRLLLRDENLDLMDLHLTNGGRAIPKLVAFEQPTSLPAEWQELFQWGPRPAEAQNFVIEMKKANAPFEELSEKLHKWYSDNRNTDLQVEILALLQGCLVAQG